MAITDLSGTKWTINSLTCSAGYGNFSIGSLIVNGQNYYDNASKIMIGYRWDGENAETVATANRVLLWGAIEYLAVGDTIEFPTGNGAAGLTNTKLISWLEANATQVKDAVVQIKPFLKGIADAIRNKKGTTETINAQNFASEIESIESGGGNLFEEEGYTGVITIDTSEGLAHTGTILGFDTNNHSFFIKKHNATLTNGEQINFNGRPINLICVETNGMEAYVENLVNIEIVASWRMGQCHILKPTANNWSFTFRSYND